MKATLKDGTIVEGTVDQINNLIKKLGTSILATDDGEPYYLSSVKGLVKISEMPLPHIRNAILKHYREWVGSLSTLKNEEIKTALHTGPTDSMFINLVKEFIARV